MDSTIALDLISLYRKRAKWYDKTSLLLYCLGFRHRGYRKRAVEALSVRQGDTVVDLGCGTGLNFGFLQKYVGPSGKIIGVDLTDAMLSEARERNRSNHWSNVELVNSDAAPYQFPSPANGILSTFAFTLVPEFDQAIAAGSSALARGRRFVILDFKKPSGWLMKRAAPALAIVLTGPFGGTLAMASRRPWISLGKNLALIPIQELYFGGATSRSAKRTKKGAVTG